MGKTETRNPQHFREMGRKMYYKHRKKILIHLRELRQQPEFKEYIERNKDKMLRLNIIGKREKKKHLRRRLTDLHPNP
jgi:RecA-family ATPase